MKKTHLLISSALLFFTLQEAVALGRSMKTTYRSELASQTNNSDNSSLPAPTPGEVWDHLDPLHLVPPTALLKATSYLTLNGSKFPNKNYMVIINFASHSKYKRFFLINLKSGEVTPLNTAHGSGSDRDHDGYADDFSNVSGSNMTSLGYYKTAETYYGSNGYSLRLDGLSGSNSRARSRAIVVHGASYVIPGASKMGRSSGCPALAKSLSSGVIDKIKNGALLYAWIPGTP